MKYLAIHKLLWFIIVVAFTLFEGIFIFVFWVLFVVWNLRFPKNLWSELHNKSAIDNNWGGYSYTDDNIWYTIIRRYKYTWKSPGYDVSVMNGKPYGRDENGNPIS